MQTTPKQFDPTKPVQTRDGRKARILGNLNDPQNRTYPIVAAVTDTDGLEFVVCYKSGGSYNLVPGEPNPLDLINIPVRREGWVNVYRSVGVSRYLLSPTREIADDRADNDRIACVRIEWEEL